MRVLKGVLGVGILASAFAIAMQYPMPTNEEKEAVLVQTLKETLSRMHFDPQTIDDDFSEEVFDSYIDELFREGRFLTQSGYDKLEVYKHHIDDEIKMGNFDFFNTATEIFDVNREKIKGYYTEILAEPFDYTVVEDIETDGEKRKMSANDKEMKEVWRKYLKYETLGRYMDKIEEQEKAIEAAKENPEAEPVEEKTKAQLEEDARNATLKVYDRWFKRLEKLKREERLSFFLNNVTRIYDPHTTYYKPIDKENFDIQFSGRLEGIGARLQTSEEYTKVSEIIVGGPAWKGKELQKDDLIMKVAQGDEEPVDIQGLEINDVVKLIRGKKDTEVRLTIKRVDGTVKVVSIIRDIVIMDERFAKSLIVDGVEEGEKIGYLYLPSFYADFEHKDGRQCAKDMAVEIEKLKEQNVDGIVLDLRNNGGGSLNDVIRISGYFIEEGPVVQVKSRGRASVVKKDLDNGVLYDGPLVVMVNSFSASASEILAAALQDYNRAIIVGSEQTFGKGTVQRFIDLDRAIRGYEEVKPLGNVKLTTQKFFRINGGSTQLQGVKSDIVLPDTYRYIKSGERELDRPLPWTEIAAVEYGQEVMQIKDKAAIQRASQERIKNNEVFAAIDDQAKYIKSLRDDSDHPLDMKRYIAEDEKAEKLSKEFKDLFEKEVVKGVQNMKVDLERIKNDESKVERNKDWIKGVKKDVHLAETLNIIHDLIEQEKKDK